MIRFTAMHRISLALVVAFAARALAAQIELTPPVPLAPEAAQPSPRAVHDIVAARSDDGFMAVWKEGDLLRSARIDFSGQLIEQFGGVLDAPFLTPVRMASDGRDFLLIAYDQIDGYRSIRISAAGAMTPGGKFSFRSPPLSFVRSGNGYAMLLPVWTSFPQTWQLMRLDAGGNVTASPGFVLPGFQTQLLVAGDTLKLIWNDQTGVYGGDVDFDAHDVRISNRTLLEAGLTVLDFQATADRPGEIALAYAPEPDRRYRFAVFSSTFRPIGDPFRFVTDLVTVPGLAATASGYAIAFYGIGERGVLTLDSRGFGKSALPGFPFVVSGPDGALAVWIDSDTTPQAHCSTIGGFEPFADRILSLSEPDQKWPRMTQAGDLVAVAWIEVKHAASELKVALVDPIGGRVVSGPVTIAEAPEFADLAIAANGDRIGIVWSEANSGADGVVLTSSLREVARMGTTTFDSLHDVVTNANGFLLAKSNFQFMDMLRFGLDGTFVAFLGGVSVATAAPDSIRIDAGATDIVVVSQVLVRSSWEAPDFHDIDVIVAPLENLGGWHNRRTIDSLEPLLGFARGDNGTLLLFFSGRTEIRSLDTLLLLSTIPNAAAAVLPWRSYADVRRSGNRITMSAGDVIETFDTAGHVLTTTPLGAGAQESRFIDGRRMVVVHDALAGSGSRRLFLRFGPVAPWHRAVGH